MDTNIEKQDNSLPQEQAAEVTETNKVEGATEVKVQEEPSFTEKQEDNQPQAQATEVTEPNKVEGAEEVKVQEEPSFAEKQEDNLPQAQTAEVAETNEAEGAAEVKVEKALSFEDYLYNEANSFCLDKQEKVPFSSAVEAVSGTSEDDELPAILGLEKTMAGGGGAKFQPNTDPNRPVAIFEYPLPGKILKMRRNGKNPTEGITIPDNFFWSAFGKSLGSLKHRDQINLLLTDNSLIVGYVVKPKNGSSKVYIPIHVWPKEIAPPTPGFIQKVRVRKVIIG
jgi:hypothetical protein